MRGPRSHWLLIIPIAATACGTADPGRARVQAPSSTVTIFQTDSQGAEIREIALGSSVWSANRGAPSVATYSTDGQLVWHGIEQGEGPDQARTIWSLVAEGDSAFAWDPLTKRLLLVRDRQVSPYLTFDFSTTHTISGSARGINFGHPGRLRRFGDGWVTYATEGPQWHAFDLTQMVLLHFDAHGRILDTLADLRSSPVFTDQAAFRASGHKELVPIPLWDVCAGVRLAIFDPASSTLAWRGVDGRVQGSLTFPFHPGEIPESFLRAHLRWQLDAMAPGRISPDTLDAWARAGFDGERWIYGKTEPFAVKMFCRGVDEVWLERFSIDAPPRGLSRQWLRVDLRSGTSREMDLPAGFQAMAADSARIYGAVEDEDGVQQVGWIPVPEPVR